jgi:hypothetical protein
MYNRNCYGPTQPMQLLDVLVDLVIGFKAQIYILSRESAVVAAEFGCACRHFQRPRCYAYDRHTQVGTKTRAKVQSTTVPGYLAASRSLAPDNDNDGNDDACDNK